MARSTMFTAARRTVAILGMALATWVVLALVLYLLLYRTVTDVYQALGRDVLQAACGRSVPNELLYTLAPGECRFANPEFDTRVIVDADGFRNAPEHLGTGPVRVAVLGDSHAIGWGVEQGEKLSSLLARDPRLTVRDLAMSSYGTARSLFALRRHAPDADVVVIQYCENDRAENLELLRRPREFIEEAPERARRYEAQMAAARVAVERPGTARRVLRFGLSALAATWRLMLLPPMTPRAPPQHEVEQEAHAFALVLQRFKAELAGKTIIVLDSFPRRARASFAPTFRARLDAEGLGHVVVLDLVGTLGPRDHFHIDEHMRPEGHAKLAARLLAELDRPGRLPVRQSR